MLRDAPEAHDACCEIAISLATALAGYLWLLDFAATGLW
jgi:hypothetical protein